MSKHVATVGLLGLCVVLAGCGGAGYEGDQRHPLSGTVTLDGEPVDVGSISLIPAGEGGRASGGLIKDGKYVIPEEKGANAGKYRVELHWMKLTGKQVKDPDTGEMFEERLEALPDKFHKNSDLTVEIPAPDDTQDLDLKS